MGIRIFILYFSWKKTRLLLRNNVPNFLNSILLYLLFPKHWTNIHIYSIRSTHNTYMVAPSLKLNTTIVTCNQCNWRTLGISTSSYLVWWSITFYENQEQFMSVADAWKERDSIFFAVDRLIRFFVVSLNCTTHTTHIDSLLLFACLHTWLCFPFKAL